MSTMSPDKINVQDFLLPRRVFTDLRPAGKAAVLRELSRRAGEELDIPADIIAAALLKREDLGSTGMGNGFAIPHACVPGLKAPFGMLARLREPIGFDAVDGQEVDVLFLLLLPEPSQGQQLNALASVARRLRDPSVLQALRDAKDPRAIYDKMIGPVG